MQEITPFLWFDKDAEAAAKYYTSIFRDSRITETIHYHDAIADPIGMPRETVMTVTFALEGQEFIALKGGSEYKFTPGISLFVNCKTQQEADALSEKLTAAGKPIQCGWLQDKSGVSWQIVPTELHTILRDDDAANSERVMQALMKMTKLDRTELRRAYQGALTAESTTSGRRQERSKS